MSSRQSRQAKHIQAAQSIQKIFTDYDDKIRSASPQPTSPYPSARFAIHRNKSPSRGRPIKHIGGSHTGNNSPTIHHHQFNNHRQQSLNVHRSNNNSPHAINTSTLRQQSLNINGNSPHSPHQPQQQQILNTKVKPLKKAKSLNSGDNISSPVTSIGSMFDTNKKSSIADLHRNNLLEDVNNKHKSLFSDDPNDDLSIGHINIPHYNTQSLFNKFEQETNKINEIFGNYQQSFSQIIREQSICITQLLNELDKKNNQIRTLKVALKKQHQQNQLYQQQLQQQSHNLSQPHPIINNNQPQHPLNGHINRTFNHPQNR